jgi:hypothetical protein
MATDIEDITEDVEGVGRAKDSMVFADGVSFNENKGRKSKLSQLRGMKFEEAEKMRHRDYQAMFHGGFTGYNTPEIPLTDEVRERHALALDIGERAYEDLARSLVKSLGAGALDRASSRTRARVKDALESFESKKHNDGSIFHSMTPPFFTAVDDLKTGTTLFDGGSFYEGKIVLPGASVPIRVKKYGDPAKFKRGLPVQRFLRRLEREGIIDQKINEPAYVDEQNGLVAELHLEGKRLVDVLRDARSDEEKADLLEPVVRDYVDISVRATQYRDMKIDGRDARLLGPTKGLEELTDEGMHYLKRQGGRLTDLRNNLPGNYVIPDQGDSDENFF